MCKLQKENLVNEEYCKDISKKVRTSFETFRKNGKFVAGIAPYGYCKDPDDIHHLIIDEESAKVLTSELDLAQTYEEVAKEVIQGKWGNGADRKAALEEAGFSYDAVQAKVNELLSGAAPAGKSVEELAKEVIQGKWGNGADRKAALEKAGYDYNAVQAKVNELLK